MSRQSLRESQDNGALLIVAWISPLTTEGTISVADVTVHVFELVGGNYRAEILEKLQSRTDAETTPFMHLFRKSRAAASIASEDDDDDSERTSLMARILFLERRMQKRTRLSQRQFRITLGVLIFVLILAIAMAITLGVTFSRSSSVSPDPCDAEFVVDSETSLALLNGMNCWRVRQLFVNGSSGALSSGRRSLLLNVQGVTGTLAMTGFISPNMTIELPALQSTGGLSVDSSFIASVSAPSLASAGDVSLSRGAFSAWPPLDAPSLATAHSISIFELDLPSANASLFPSLSSMSGPLQLSQVSTGGALVFPRLVTADRIVLLSVKVEYPSPDHLSFSFPSLVEASSVLMDSCSPVDAISMPNVEKLGDLYVANIFVTLSGSSRFSSVAFDMGSLRSVATVIVRATFGLRNLTFPSMTSMYFGLVDTTTSLVEANFPRLQSVDDILFAFNSNLLTVNFASLQTVTKTLRFTANPVLSVVSAPGCKEAAVLVALNMRVTSVSLPSLTRGSLAVTSNTALTAVSVPSLTYAGIVAIFDNPALQTLHFPSLAEASTAGWVRNEGPIGLYWVLAQDRFLGRLNVSLSSVSESTFVVGQAIVSGSVSFFTNANLTSVSLPKLRRANLVIIDDNPQMCASDFSMPLLTESSCGCALKFDPALACFTSPPPSVAAACNGTRTDCHVLY